MKTLKWNAIWGAVMVLTACSPSEKQENVPSQATPNDDLPVYQVITDATYPPFESIDDKGNIIGLDMDLLNAIAENQGFRVSYRIQIWDGMFDELQKDQAQIIASAVAISDNEDNIALLSEPYLQSRNCVAATDKQLLTTWMKGDVAAAKNEDLHEDLPARFAIHKDKIHLLDTPFLGLKAVAANRVGASVADCTVMTYHANSPTFKDFTFHINELPTPSDDDVNLVFAVSQKHPELLQKINQGLANVKQNGQYDQILQKWRLK